MSAAKPSDQLARLLIRNFLCTSGHTIWTKPQFYPISQNQIGYLPRKASPEFENPVHKYFPRSVIGKFWNSNPLGYSIPFDSPSQVQQHHKMGDHVSGIPTQNLPVLIIGSALVSLIMGWFLQRSAICSYGEFYWESTWLCHAEAVTVLYKQGGSYFEHHYLLGWSETDPHKNCMAFLDQTNEELCWAEHKSQEGSS